MSGFVLVRDNPFWARVARRRQLRDPGRAGRNLGGEGLARARRARAPRRCRCRKRPRPLPSFTLDASKYKRAPHKNKFGKDYEVGEKY